MRKKFLIGICTLALMLGLSACGSKDDELIGGLPEDTYYQMLSQTMTQLESFDEASIDTYITQSESSGDTVSAGLLSDLKECYSDKGELVDFYDKNKIIGGIKLGGLHIGGQKAFDVAKSGKTITATLVGDYSKRDLKLTVVFNANKVQDGPTAINIERVYSLGETMQKAGLNTVMGILIVFCMLVVMSGVIKCFEIIPKLEKKAKEKNAPEEKPVAAPVVATAAAPKKETDDLQLVAVIAAAIAASTGASTDSFVVRSIKKRY